MDTPLRRWRIARGLTQEEFGEKIGVKRKAISRYENGERIPYHYLQELKNVTGLSYEALLRPAEYLKAYPDYRRQGKRPLQEGPGRPRRPEAVAQ